MEWTGRTTRPAINYSFCTFAVLVGIDGVKRNIDVDNVLNGEGTQEKD
jgi:hypothetical protein